MYIYLDVRKLTVRMEICQIISKVKGTLYPEALSKVKGRSYSPGAAFLPKGRSYSRLNFDHNI
eukprot:10688162-Ditylum_brightwellii.AAC.1